MSGKRTTGNGQGIPDLAQSFMFPGFIFNAWAPALACGAASSTKLTEGFATLGGEWQDFVSRRLNEDVCLMQGLAACKSPQEGWTTSLKFWEKVADDYWKEYATIVKLAGGIMTNSMSAMQRRMEEATGESLPRAKAA